MNEKRDSLTPEILSLMEPKATQVYGEIRDSVQTIAGNADTIQLFAEAGKIGTFDQNSPRGRALSRLGDVIDAIVEVADMKV